jgi:iron complex outermembrane receptor protein
MFAGKLRLVAGLRADKFNYPDTTYLSTELAATYKINKRNLIRAVYSTSPRSASIFDTYVDQPVAYIPIGRRKFARLVLAGNKNLKLLTASMFELGYRSKLTTKLDVDVELFDINASNYVSLVTAGPSISIVGMDTILTSPLRSLNLPITVHQQGLTASVNYTSERFQLKPFVTVQRTRLKNYSEYNNTPDALPMFARVANPALNNMYSAMGKEIALKSTPAVFGGVSANYAITSKLSTNVNAYYYSRQTYSHLTNVFFRDGIRGIDNIDAKFILNAGVSYEAIKGLHIFCTGKNILNDKSREFFRTDAVPFMLLGGINYTF